MAWPLAPVDRANKVSPSDTVCTGLMLRARPSWATLASCLAWALVSTASVPMTPMVVAMPAGASAESLLGQRPLQIAARMSSGVRPSSANAPARMRPLRGSTTSPIAFTATSAATVMPSTHSDAMPMPPFMARPGPNSLPTVAPAPAPTLPCAVQVVLAASHAV